VPCQAGCRKLFGGPDRAAVECADLPRHCLASMSSIGETFVGVGCLSGDAPGENFVVVLAVPRSQVSALLGSAGDRAPCPLGESFVGPTWR